MDYIHPVGVYYDGGRKILWVIQKIASGGIWCIWKKRHFRLISMRVIYFSKYVKNLFEVFFCYHLMVNIFWVYQACCLNLWHEALFLGMSKWKNWIKVISQINGSNNSSQYLIEIFNVFGIFFFWNSLLKVAFKMCLHY